MENEVNNQLIQFYQEWFNALSKQVHFIEFKVNEAMNDISTKLEEIDYRFTLLEDKVLRLEDRINGITQLKTSAV